MSLLDVSSMLEYRTFVFAGSGDEVRKSSWVRGSYRFRSHENTRRTVIHHRDFHLHVYLHQLGGRLKFLLGYARPRACIMSITPITLVVTVALVNPAGCGEYVSSIVSAVLM